MPSYQPIPAVADETGIAARTLRTWAVRGLVASLPPVKGQRGRRVDPVEVVQVAHARGLTTAATANSATAARGTELEPGARLDGAQTTARATRDAVLERVGSPYGELRGSVDRLLVESVNRTEFQAESQALRAEVRQLRWLVAGLAALLVLGLVAVLLTR